MAKLVDAPGLGPDARNGVGVRVPLLAPHFNFHSFPLASYFWLLHGSVHGLAH